MYDHLNNLIRFVALRNTLQGLSGVRFVNTIRAKRILTDTNGEEAAFNSLRRQSTVSATSSKEHSVITNTSVSV